VASTKKANPDAPDIVDARCKKQGYHSPSGTMYEVGQSYSVDQNDAWVRNHFEVEDQVAHDPKSDK